MIGNTISHYKILEKLGEGGMGVVYKAEDIKLERIVALKFLPPHLSNQEEEKKRFIHEAKAASALEHSNICTIHEIDETNDGQLFIVMSYLEGKTLKERINVSPLKVEEAIGITIQAAEGLKQAHEKGIVHRDIKPANIMITTDDTVKIMDFGLAKLGGKTKLTQMGTTLGTFSYMSPEQSRGEDVDRRTDIWSLGVVLYEMLTGQQPFKGDYEQAVVYSIVNEEPEPMTAVRTGIPMELERIVNKALAKNPDERYQHIDDLLTDLRTERKNLEYARAGYIKAQMKESKSPKVKAKGNALKIIIPSAVVVILAIIFFVINPFKFWGEQNSTYEPPVKSLAVMYFENIPDPDDKDHTGEMLTNLLITSLSQIKGVEVISRERLFDIQKDLGEADTKSISASFASQIAKRAGVTTMLIGSILQDNPTLAVTTRLIDVQSGKIISSQQVTNFAANQIFNLVDSLSYLLRKNFQVASTSLAEIKPVAEVTTKSLEAYRAYAEGLDFFNKVYYKESSIAFTKAVELDSNFAMAHFYLGISQRSLGDYAKSLKSYQKAVELSGNTTERERLLILAQNYRVQSKRQQAIEIYEQLIEKYPYETFAYDALYQGFALDFLKPEQAVKVLREGLKIDPSAKLLWNDLAYCFAFLNRKQEALNAVNEYVKLAPAEPNPYDSKGDIYAWFLDYDSSRIEYQKAVKLRGDFLSADKLGFYYVLRQQYNDAQKYFQMSGFKYPVIETHRGQIKYAKKKYKELLSSQISQRERQIILAAIVHLYYETDEFPEMLRMAIELSSKRWIAWALVKNGKSGEAHKLLEDLQKEEVGSTTAQQVYTEYSSALVSFEEGKNELALEKFRKVFQSLPPNHEPNIFYALALLRSGQASEAIEELQRLVYWPVFENYPLERIPGAKDYWPISAVKAHYWLGVAYEQLGQKEKALKEYEEFLDIWKDADFNSPEIKDVKIRVAKLKGIASK
jgi:serine/threonine protein kinase/cytochrome c-type biogenesis protein CcmH/NrfG